MTNTICSITFENNLILLNGSNNYGTGTTYYLKVTDMSNSVTIINNTIPQQRVYVKLWADFTNNIPNNIPTGTFIIDGNDITLDGQGLELDLNYSSLLNSYGYIGLLKVNDGSQSINIQNINAIIGSEYNLLSTGSLGWICQGLMNETDINFNNCLVTLPSDIVIENVSGFDDGYGGICGGNNGQNTSCSLSFTNCYLISTYSSITSTINNDNNVFGGICGGGKNKGNYTFTNCNVKSYTNNKTRKCRTPYEVILTF